MAQPLNYLRATSVELGLLLNFGLRPEFKRLVFIECPRAIRLKRAPTIGGLLLMAAAIRSLKPLKERASPKTARLL